MLEGIGYYVPEGGKYTKIMDPVGSGSSTPSTVLPFPGAGGGAAGGGAGGGAWWWMPGGPSGWRWRSQSTIRAGRLQSAF